ncbi:hypothetical protein BN2475_120069 [Paraburkholderia ribeironis]|uniref:Uncharacterized protein n=1 Tax=Paraburkholderia ribeironis TaxID=1247936 RepID=A0A1N7RQU8_9BURK|nr:hypothetical protein BN2475_120069 [Paraburkholderia ribeironis]
MCPCGVGTYAFVQVATGASHGLCPRITAHRRDKTGHRMTHGSQSAQPGDPSSGYMCTGQTRLSETSPI